MKRNAEVKASELKVRITLQAPQYAQDSSGEVQTTWNDVVTVWASKEVLRGREEYRQQALHYEQQVRFRIRYREGLLRTYRVKHGEVFYEILSIEEVNGDECTLTIIAINKS